MRDVQDLEVTCTHAEALAALNEFIRRDIYYEELCLSQLISAMPDAPEAVLLHVYAAICHLYMDSHQAPAIALTDLLPVRGLPMNPREVLWVSIIDAWAESDLKASVELILKLLKTYPQDLLAARLGIVHCLLQGDQPHMLSIASLVLSVPKNMENGPALSFLSFAYLENGDLETAARYARAALDLDPHLGWAQHNLAHVFATRNEFEAGIAVLEGHQSDWKGLFINAHCNWHLGIFYILTHRTSEAIRIYQEVLLGMKWWHVVNMINILSMLLYLDLFGCDIVPLVTGDLLLYMRNRDKWGLDGLVDMLSVWTLLKCGDVQTAEELAALENSKDNQIWHTGCSAMRLLSQNDRAGAASLLLPLINRLIAFGGSNEQRKAITDACRITRVELLT